jgi:predicted nucleic acid-binding protein
VALDFSERLLNDSEIEMTWVDETLHRDALALLQIRPDKSYSLCDAVSFLVMRDRNISEALSTDRHFAQEGFVKLI